MRPEIDADETDLADAARDACGDPESPVWRGRVMARRMQGEHDDELRSADRRIHERAAAQTRDALERPALSDGDPDAALVARVGARDASAVRVLVAR